MSSPASAATDGGHRSELDVVRILTFACVIIVHVVSHTARGEPVLVGSLILMHFTREVFFALSGFVLTYTYLRRPQPMRRFWPKRFLLVGAPYVVWSLVYSGVAWVHDPVDGWTYLSRLGREIATGTAYYHLYFLLVTMQLYLLFPLLVRLVRATRGHHTLVVGIALAAQLVISGLDSYAPGSLHWLNIASNVIDYQALIIGGAVAADHADALLAWVRRRLRAIGVAVAVAAVVTLAGYALQLAVGFSPYRAATAYQPLVIAWSVVVGIGLLALGAWWVDRRDGPRPVLGYLSDRSFGVFLAHPLVLWGLLAALDAWGWTRALPPVVVAVVAYPLVAGGALLIADLARRSPLSLVLAGRRRPRHRPRTISDPA